MSSNVGSAEQRQAIVVDAVRKIVNKNATIIMVVLVVVEVGVDFISLSFLIYMELSVCVYSSVSLVFMTFCLIHFYSFQFGG